MAAYPVAAAHVPCPDCETDKSKDDRSFWFHDWTTQDAQGTQILSYGLRGIVLPAKRLLYKGVDRSCPDDTSVIPSWSFEDDVPFRATFAATLSTACLYAFDAFQRKNACHGKVIALETRRPLRLVNMWDTINHATIQYLATEKACPIPVDTKKSGQSLLHLCFPCETKVTADGEFLPHQWQRSVSGAQDEAFVLWFEQFRKHYPDVDGWYVLPEAGDLSWHDEVCIYQPEETLQRRQEIEVRCRYTDLPFLELCVAGESRMHLSFRDRCRHNQLVYDAALMRHGRVTFHGPRFSGTDDRGLNPSEFRPSEAYLWERCKTQLIQRITWQQQLVEADVRCIRFIRDPGPTLQQFVVKRDPSAAALIEQPCSVVVAYIYYRHPDKVFLLPASCRHELRSLRQFDECIVVDKQ